MAKSVIQGLQKFLKEYPGMVLAPSHGGSGIIVQGEFTFNAKLEGKESITDRYQLRIDIPSNFPNELPEVTEIDRKILREIDHHVNDDNTLCLGSPLRLQMIMVKKPCLVNFAEKCLVPYLYNTSHKLLYGGDFPTGDLAHGTEGAIHDYLVLFNLFSPSQVIQTLKLLEKKKRIANKEKCPCGCGKKLGKCSFRITINKFREVANRSWHKKHLIDLAKGI